MKNPNNQKYRPLTKSLIEIELQPILKKYKEVLTYVHVISGFYGDNYVTLYAPNVIEARLNLEKRRIIEPLCNTRHPKLRSWSPYLVHCRHLNNPYTCIECDRYTPDSNNFRCISGIWRWSEDEIDINYTPNWPFWGSGYFGAKKDPKTIRLAKVSQGCIILAGGEWQCTCHGVGAKAQKLHEKGYPPLTSVWNPNQPLKDEFPEKWLMRLRSMSGMYANEI